MDVLEFLEEKHRMTKRCTIDCENCLLCCKHNGFNLSCFDLERQYPREYIEIVEKWSKSSSSNKTLASLGVFKPRELLVKRRVGMTKRELKTGMVVIDRAGHQWFVLKESYVKLGGNFLEGNFLVNKNGSWVILDDFNEDLTYPNCKDMDIVEVLKVEHIQDLVKSVNKAVVIWKRKDPPKKLTLSELEAILGYEVEIVDGEHSKGQSCTNNSSKTIDK